MRLLHIAEQAVWNASGATYAPDAFRDEGFVHCSFPSQVVATAGRYYVGRTDLVLLEIDPARLSAAVIDEPSPSTGEVFPHIYGPIERSAVVGEHEFVPTADGGFALPAALRDDT